MTANVALFGLGLYRVEWFRAANAVPSVDNPLIVAAIKGAMVLAIELLIWAVTLLMWSGNEQKGATPVHSRALLSLPESYIQNPPVSTARAQQHVFVCLYRAFQDLQQ